MCGNISLHSVLKCNRHNYQANFQLKYLHLYGVKEAELL